MMTIMKLVLKLVELLLMYDGFKKVWASITGNAEEVVSKLEDSGLIES